jgi:hypothetical protein
MPATAFSPILSARFNTERYNYKVRKNCSCPLPRASALLCLLLLRVKGGESDGGKGVFKGSKIVTRNESVNGGKIDKGGRTWK